MCTKRRFCLAAPFTIISSKLCLLLELNLSKGTVFTNFHFKKRSQQRKQIDSKKKNYFRETYSFGQGKSFWNNKTMAYTVLLPHTQPFIQTGLNYVPYTGHTLSISPKISKINRTTAKLYPSPIPTKTKKNWTFIHLSQIIRSIRTVGFQNRWCLPEFHPKRLRKRWSFLKLSSGWLMYRRRAKR